ncbi:hypothetical protein [Aquabacterium sp.]
MPSRGVLDDNILRLAEALGVNPSESLERPPAAWHQRPMLD